MVTSELKLCRVQTGGAKNREVRSSISPQTGEEIGKFEIADEQDAAQMASIAQGAFLDWSGQTGVNRAAALYRWADVIDRRKVEGANLICDEVGKPIGEAIGEAGRAVAILRYFAAQAVNPNGDLVPSQAQNHLQFTERKPLGVVGLITPWNFPLAIPLWKAAPALAYGNTVVIKPSELSSLCSDWLRETAEEAQLPTGIFNILFGDGTSGSALLKQPQVRAVSFTGSSATGQKVIEACASARKRVQCEMGGKNPTIVLADADLKLAATMAASAAFRFAGQKCTATSRVIIDNRIYEPFLDELISATEKLKNGDPHDSATAIGPVISKATKSRLEKIIDDCKENISYKGEAEDSKGAFVAPVIYRDVAANSRIATEELFGPVLAAIQCEGIEDAVKISNSVEYGLSASIFTQNLSNAFQYMRQIHAGMVRVNADTTGVDPHAPFGGTNVSSYGPREQGQAARDFYTESITYQINPL